MTEMIEEIKQEKKILKELTDMREKFIKEELLKGNSAIRDQINDLQGTLLSPLDSPRHHTSPSAAQALRLLNKKRNLKNADNYRNHVTQMERGKKRSWGGIDQA